jgi:hypothetical protein
MNKVFKLSLVLSLFLVVFGCGHKQNPTGGKLDIEKVKILSVSPDQFSDLTNKQIDITFSKVLDRTKVPTGIYIYPPIDRKRFKYQGNHLLLRIMETLKPNTNYYFTFTPRIQDEHGNFLEDNQTFVYANGSLQTNRISGEINLENPEDAKLPINLSLLDSDTLLVYNKVIRGSTYELENLNKDSYILRAFIDKNVNGKYDFGIDPYAESNSSSNPISTINLNLVYSDTIKVVLKSVNVKSNREFDILFSEPVKSIGAIHISARNGSVELPIELKKLDGSMMTVLTAAQDTLKYEVSIRDISDRKNNTTTESHLYFFGIPRADKTPPMIVSTTPRNGTSINELMPELSIVFSEIIPKNNIKYNLIDTETNQKIDLNVISGDDKVYRFQPRKPLQNYHSYKFIINHITSDISSNALGKDYEFLFLTLIKNGG